MEDSDSKAELKTKPKIKALGSFILVVFDTNHNIRPKNAWPKNLKPQIIIINFSLLSLGDISSK